MFQFLRSFKRNDKPVCTAAVKFIAHLVNQQVAHPYLGLQVAVLLLGNPSDDSVELAVSYIKEVGAMLQDVQPESFRLCVLLSYLFDCVGLNLDPISCSKTRRALEFLVTC